MSIEEYLVVEEEVIGLFRNQLKPHLKYHCLAHTQRVIEKAIVIGNFEQISGHDLILVQLAALFHDAGFLIDENDHENSSCKIARDFLTDTNLSSSDVEQICGMIEATNIPQVANSKLEMIVLDADMEYLGTDDYDSISSHLLEEIRHSNPNFSDLEWLKLQINFLESHSFFTNYAKDKLTSTKIKNLSKLKAELLRFR